MLAIFKGQKMKTLLFFLLFFIFICCNNNTSTSSNDQNNKNIPEPKIEFSPDYIEFPVNSDTISNFYIKNIGDTTLLWSIREKPNWATLYPDSGIIPINDSMTVMLKIDRKLIQYSNHGNISEFVEFNTNNRYVNYESLEINVEILHPIVGRWNLIEAYDDSVLLSQVTGYQIYKHGIDDLYTPNFQASIQYIGNYASIASRYQKPNQGYDRFIYYAHGGLNNSFNTTFSGVSVLGGFSGEVHFDSLLWPNFGIIGIGVNGIEFSINNDTLIFIDNEDIIKYVKE